jgi:formylglycine-generating enzyme required for sulfatase activity
LNKKRFRSILFTFTLASLFYGETLVSREYQITAVIETRRKGNLVTILFKRIPEKARYLIIENKKVIGEIDLMKVSGKPDAGKRFRGIATYRLFREKDELLIRSGSEIGLLKKTEKYVRDFRDPPFFEKLNFSRRKISVTDEREMVLIPAGKFIFGSDSGDRDESPEQVVYLDAFYIDRYEVSNREYMKFVETTHGRPPASWANGTYGEGAGDLPVLVTYHEALAYAGWCGKRLPSEHEWEKAARGHGGAGSATGGEKSLKLVYPWGRKFNPERVNSLEFWSRKKTGKGIKEYYSVTGERYLSVYSFEKRGESPYSVFNMSGNALEWTSSWYLPYKGNSHDDRRYGTQYKVMRGGAWFSNKQRVRVTSREIGGIPNLYSDSIAGFRCVKEPTSLDRID